MTVVLVAATLVAASCDNGDTIVSVNYSFDDATAANAELKAVKLHITIKPNSGSEVTSDIDIMRDSDGGITNASYKRVTVNGMSGPATVTVVARDSSGSDLSPRALPVDPKLLGDPASPKDLVVDVVAHGAIAAYVKFMVPVVPVVVSDAGAAETGTPDGTGGSGTGSGGSSGSGGSGSGGSGSDGSAD